jgi:hypothetical protein
MIEANTITKGQTFKTEQGILTAVENVKRDKFSVNSGWKVLVTNGADEFWHLFGFKDMVTVA